MKKQSTKNSEYDFYGRLTAEFPSQIIVDVTEACNLSCIHCPHPSFKESKYYAKRHLDPALNKKMVDEVCNHGKSMTQYIRYASSGESLVHPQAYDMIQYAVDHSGVPVNLTTNGTIMNEAKFKQLLEAGIDLIDFSIDANTPEVYAKIRVGGKLERTRTNVLKVIQMIQNSEYKTRVAVSFIEQPENTHEADDFDIFWKDNGANYVIIRRLHSAAGAIKDIADLMKRRNTAKERRPCLYPWERIVLNPRGYLSFCPADWTHGSTMVDFHATTIKETWQGDSYQKLREAHMINNFKNHTFCRQCPDWVETRWPDEGRSYANMMEEIEKQ